MQSFRTEIDAQACNVSYAVMHSYANELFAIDVAGDDLLLAVLKMLNCIKERQQFPKAFESVT